MAKYKGKGFRLAALCMLLLLVPLGLSQQTDIRIDEKEYF